MQMVFYQAKINAADLVKFGFVIDADVQLFTNPRGIINLTRLCLPGTNDWHNK